MGSCGVFDLSKTSFDSAVRGCGGNPLAEPDEHARLLRAYAQTHRAYHTAQHLGECLAHLQQAQSALAPVEIAEIALAFWYHDAVYRPQRMDNEARSARWLCVRAQQFGISPSAIERLVAMILATRHGIEAVPDEPQTQLLLDIDLAILAAPTERFQEYCEQIRFEYAFVPAAIFAPKRAQILREFLSQPKIYHSFLGAKFEAAARLNLATEISNLLGPDGSV
jgi:predicted metal-dependent HD superfamily phosphohydrolase